MKEASLRAYAPNATPPVPSVRALARKTAALARTASTESKRTGPCRATRPTSETDPSITEPLILMLLLDLDLQTAPRTAERSSPETTAASGSCQAWTLKEAAPSVTPPVRPVPVPSTRIVRRVRRSEPGLSSGTAPVFRTVLRNSTVTTGQRAARAVLEGARAAPATQAAAGVIKDS